MNSQLVKQRIKKLMLHELVKLHEQVISKQFYEPKQVNIILKDLKRSNKHIRLLK